MSICPARLADLGKRRKGMNASQLTSQTGKLIALRSATAMAAREGLERLDTRVEIVLALGRLATNLGKNDLVYPRCRFFASVSRRSHQP